MPPTTYYSCGRQLVGRVLLPHQGSSRKEKVDLGPDFICLQFSHLQPAVHSFREQELQSIWTHSVWTKILKNHVHVFLQFKNK